MNKTQHYTTVPQSKILLECGLDPNTADMFFNPQMDIEGGVAAGFVETPECYPYNEIQENKQLYLPCWSTTALIEQIPPCFSFNNQYGKWYVKFKSSISSPEYNSLFEAAFDTVIDSINR